MGSGGGAPQPPGLSQEEKNLLASQNLTLEQFNKILGQSTLDSKDTQDLLRQISGLYKKETTAERRIPGKATDAINTQLIQTGITSLQSNPRNTTVIAPDSKPITMAELQRAQSDLAYAKERGYVTSVLGPEEVIPASESWVLNQKAVDDLRARVVAEEATMQKIKALEDQRYIDALEGRTPLSTGLIQQKETDFRLLKEAAARRGIIIDGDSPESASSQSSAGNELVGQFKRTYGLLESSERRAVVEGGATTSQPSYAPMLNYAMSSTSAGPTNLLPTYSNLSSMYSGASTPYYNQRALDYSGKVAGYNQGQQGRAALTGLLATGAATAAKVGGPPGWIAGAGLGLAALGSAYL